METYRIDCFLIPRKHRLQEKKLSRESLVARGISMATVQKPTGLSSLAEVLAGFMQPSV